jgi:DNA ligase-1
MRRFARLLERLQETRDSTEQALHLRRYLHAAAPADAAVAVHLLAGGRTGPRLPAALLAASAARAAQLPPALFDACRAAASDLAETIALVVPSPREPDDAPLRDWLHHRLPDLHARSPAAQADRLAELWPTLGPGTRRVLAELMQGRLQRPPGLDALATLLARALEQDPASVAHRLARFVEQPTPAAFTALTAPPDATGPRPAPFAALIEADAAPAIGADRWIGWCPDGLRAQLVRHGTETALWSEQAQRLNPRFLDLIDAAQAALPPNTVLDGWIVAPGARGLAHRLGTRPLSRTTQSRDPVRFVAMDTPCWAGEPLERRSRRDRLSLLTQHLAPQAQTICAPPALAVDDHEALLRQFADGRRQRATGLLWANLDDPGPWTHWPLPPLAACMVLVYAETGPRGYAHFSFAVQGSTGWTTVVRLSTDAAGEWAAQLSDTVRAGAVRRIGPIHEVTAEHVYELAFDALYESPRRRCGLLLHRARLLRPRHDLPVQQANTLADLQALLHRP